MIKDINNWHQIKHSLAYFQPILKLISDEAKVELGHIEPCIPASNAVFKTSQHIIKIFPPNDIGISDDYHVELSALEYCEEIDVRTPGLVSAGLVHYNQDYQYIVMKKINGRNYSDLEENYDDQDKFNFAIKLLGILDKLNAKPANIRTYETGENKDWQVFSEDFNNERQPYLDRLHIDHVFVNGDLNPDNILIDHDDNIHLIDFADACNASIDYEFAGMVCYLFAFEKPYMKACRQRYDLDVMVEKLLRGILSHDYGVNMIKCNLGNPEDIDSLEVLRERIRTAIISGSQHKDSLSYLSGLSS